MSSELNEFENQAKVDHARADAQIEKDGETSEWSSYLRRRAQWNELLAQNQKDREANQ